MTFAEELRCWRGKLLQKEAADILGVPLDTYRAWEHNQREPRDEVVTKTEIRRRMEARRNG